MKLSLESPGLSGSCPSVVALASKSFKACGCGRSFDCVEWNLLPLAGYMLDLELRQCHCESTLAIPRRR